MITGNAKNDEKLKAFLLSIKKEIEDWKLLNFCLSKHAQEDGYVTLEKLVRRFRKWESMAFPAENNSVFMLVKLGYIRNYDVLKNEISEALPEYHSHMNIDHESKTGLEIVKIDLSLKGADGLHDYNLAQERKKRAENIVMIADDDFFVRETIRRALGYQANVCEVDNGVSVADEYMVHNPDVLLLDIHMPGKSGFDVIDEIKAVDNDAYVIFFSSDYDRENIKTALDKDGVGFLTKPVSRKKLFEYIGQCKTFNNAS